jgi:dipeptidyl aminopeptidase/acylaminoacyl peptidase
MVSTPVAREDLASFADLSAVQLSADGTRFAVMRSTPNLVENRYDEVVATGTVDSSRPPEVLSVPSPSWAESLPRWSPSGGDLATVGQGERGWQVHVRTGEEQVPYSVVEGWRDPIEELSWSPNGALLLFVAREPVDREWWDLAEDRRPPLHVTRLRYREDGVGWTFNRPRQAYLVSVGLGEVRKLSEGGYDDSEFSWHPDGHTVYFVSQRTPEGESTLLNDIYQQSVVVGSTAQRLTATGFAYSQPRVSPDGSRVAFTAIDVADFPAASRLCVAPADGGEMTILSRGLDRDVNGDWTATNGPIWVGSTTVVALVEDSGKVHGYAFDATGDAETPWRVMLGGDRQATSLDAREGVLAFVSTTPTEPPHLVVQREGHAEVDAWSPNAELTGSRALWSATAAPVRLTADHEVDSWLTLPDSEQWQAPYPLVVCMQGGGQQHGYQWSQEFQALTGAGFATLWLNPRGCSGYGEAWMRAVSGPAAKVPGRGWGVDDISDVVQVVESTLQRNSELDPARVGVMGGSYGGLVTTWLLAKSDLFAAGWAERGPYNLFSLGGTNDESPWFFNTYLGRSLVEDPAAYWSTSVLSVAEGITDPVIIVHSEEDLRCPIQQAEELYMTLKLLGREVEFVRFPGESHGLSRNGSPVHRLQRLELQHEWFTRHLKPVASAERSKA